MSRWALLALATLVIALPLTLVDLGGAPLLAALVAGTVLALVRRGPADVPRWSARAAEALIGVSIGTNVSPESLSEAGSHWLVVVLVCLLTLVVSMASGLVLATRADIDRVTGVLSLTAGGASGLVAMSSDLGADSRVVAVLQYIRVLLITFTNPLVAALLAGQVLSSPHVAIQDQPPTDWPVVVAVYAAFGACVLGGPWLGAKLRVPAGALLVPMVVVGTMGAFGLPVGIGVPDPVIALAFLVIGWGVGLRFTRAALRSVARLLPTAMTLTVLLVLACGGIGYALSAVTGFSVLEGYLATTPGGLPVVLGVALAVDDVDAAFVSATQIVRVFLMLLISPLLARILARGGESSAGRAIDNT